MNTMIKEYGGVLLLYIVIFIGVIAISERISMLNKEEINTNIVAVSK